MAFPAGGVGVGQGQGRGIPCSGGGGGRAWWGYPYMVLAGGGRTGGWGTLSWSWLGCPSHPVDGQSENINFPRTPYAGVNNVNVIITLLHLHIIINSAYLALIPCPTNR